MTRAIVLGLLQYDYPENLITLSNRSAEKLDFYRALSLQTTQDNAASVSSADVVVLAVKPYQIKAVCEEISDKLSEHAVVISVAAGITVAHIEKALGRSSPVVRAMPNIGSMVSAGVTGMFANTFVSEPQREFVESLFRSTGIALWLSEETLVPAITAVSGSGIAYYFLFMEIMAKEAEHLGLSADVVELLVSQTVLGAAKLSLESDQSFAALRESVISPNGTTEQAIKSMNNASIEQTITNAMRAAFKRSKEITETLCD